MFWFNIFSRYSEALLTKNKPEIRIEAEPEFNGAAAVGDGSCAVIIYHLFFDFISIEIVVKSLYVKSNKCQSVVLQSNCCRNGKEHSYGLGMLFASFCLILF